jgi:hypothetical protein
MPIAIARNSNGKPLTKTNGIFGISRIISQAQCSLADTLFDIAMNCIRMREKMSNLFVPRKTKLGALVNSA